MIFLRSPFSFFFLSFLFLFIFFFFFFFASESLATSKGKMLILSTRAHAQLAVTWTTISLEELHTRKKKKRWEVRGSINTPVKDILFYLFIQTNKYNYKP